ncbi:MAG: hypothetical protein GY739_00190, partial [Mesoflavibacter sp.]|nr:hypothetical protein [Mesoflavibacter sp.]
GHASDANADGLTETVRFTYGGLVRDSDVGGTALQRGDTFESRLVFTSDGVTGLELELISPTVRVVEPDLTDLTVSPLSVVDVDGSDEVTFTVTFGHEGVSDSPAHNVVLIDDAVSAGPPAYTVEIVRVNGVVVYNASVDGAGTLTSDGILAVLPFVDVGVPTSIEYTVSLPDDVQVGTQLSPALRLEYSSVPDLAVSRNYTDVPAAVPVVNVTDTLDVSQTAELVSDGDAPAPLGGVTPVTVGGTVQIAYEMEVPEGVTSGVSVQIGFSDPSILQLLSTDPNVTLSIVSSSGAVSSTCGPASFADAIAAAVIGADGASITLPLCDLVNTDDDNSVTETLRIVLTGVVQDSPTAVQGAGFVGTVNVTSTHGSDVNLVTAGGVVAESGLETPDVTPPSMAAPYDAGDVLEYSVVLQHTPGSDADAYFVTLRDASLRQQVNDTGDLEGSAGNVPLYVVSGVAFDGVPQALDVAAFYGDGTVFVLPELTEAAGSAVVTFNLTLLTPVEAGTGLLPDFTVEWGSSTRVADSRQRTLPAVQNGPAAVTLAEPVITVASRTDASTAANDEYSIGSTVWFDVQVTMPEGTMRGSVLTLSLDDATRFQFVSSGVASIAASGDVSSSHG